MPSMTVPMPMRAAEAAAMTGRQSARRLKAWPLLIGLTGLVTLHSAGQSFISVRQTPSHEQNALTQRRQLLAGLGLAAAAPAVPAFAAESYTDINEGFEFRYPNGLQKSSSPGYDVFLRDILEPLEFIGVKVTETKRNNLDEVGTPQEVAEKLLKDLVPEGAPKEIISAKSRDDKYGFGRQDIIEFAYQWKFDEGMARQLGRKRFQVHMKALVSINRGKQFLVVIGSEENRWDLRGTDYNSAIDTFKFSF
mmetsp:Transcript_7801/g.12408  ORF Transcript_7801/g.12408 Transcript_7801/m.12408 type:complete len:250 (+) Transcript_7801:78-827(+)